MAVEFVKKNAHYIKCSIDYFIFARKYSFIHLSAEKGFKYKNPTTLCYYLKTDGIGGGGDKK